MNPPLAAPPRARMAFRVGVVGHRPDRLPADAAGLESVRARLAQVLASVSRAVSAFHLGPDAGFYAPGAPLLRANSPLAEGADRLFADEALDLGYELCCVMPFAQEDFEVDFQAPEAIEADSLDRFRALLAKAGGRLRRFQLDGHRDRRAEAYEAAGRVVLNQSDLLLVVWDGGDSNGMGGTLDTLRQAIAFSVPALWIDSRAPFGWKLLRSQSDLDCLARDGACSADLVDAEQDRRLMDSQIGEVVASELGVPAFDNSGETRDHLANYVGESRPRLNLAFHWKMFRDLLDRGAPRLPAIRVADYVDQIKDEWPIPEQPTGAREAAMAWINRALRAHYAWSDKLADRYADAHRSGFVCSSLLAAATVFLALLPTASRWRSGSAASLTTAAIEAVILVLMVSLPVLARKRRWHQRWMEYRVLAELIRELRILIPLGGGRPLPRTPAHLSNYGDPTKTWMYWQMRAIARATDLPEVKIDHAYLEGQIEDLLDFVGEVGEKGGDPGCGQAGFHDINCERLHRIHQNLHALALGLFSLTIVGVVANWALPVMLHSAEPLGRWPILVSAFFPALGAALASINNQGEFARLQRRSRAMKEGFIELHREIVGLQESGHVTLADLTELAARTAAMMIDENTDWRIVVLDLPHAAG